MNRNAGGCTIFRDMSGEFFSGTGGVALGAFCAQVPVVIMGRARRSTLRNDGVMKVLTVKLTFD